MMFNKYNTIQYKTFWVPFPSGSEHLHQNNDLVGLDITYAKLNIDENSFRPCL